MYRLRLYKVFFLAFDRFVVTACKGFFKIKCVDKFTIAVNVMIDSRELVIGRCLVRYFGIKFSKRIRFCWWCIGY